MQLQNWIRIVWSKAWNYTSLIANTNKIFAVSAASKLFLIRAELRKLRNLRPRAKNCLVGLWLCNFVKIPLIYSTSLQWPCIVQGKFGAGSLAQSIGSHWTVLQYLKNVKNSRHSHFTRIKKNTDPWKTFANYEMEFLRNCSNSNLSYWNFLF